MDLKSAPGGRVCLFTVDNGFHGDYELGRLRANAQALGCDLYIYQRPKTSFAALYRLILRESAALLRRRIAELGKGCRIVVTGDFNTGEGTPPYETLFAADGETPATLVDTFRVAVPEAGAAGPEGTFTGFDAGNTGGDRIDWIFTAPSLAVERCDIDASQRDGRWPSDHAFVRARVRARE